jgi:CheY-specific phosphatase CheX
MCEVPASSLNSTEAVNTLVGISGDMEGNIMFGYTDKTAKELAAKMMGTSEVSEIDIFVKSALADFYSEFCKKVTYEIKIKGLSEIKNSDSKSYTLLSTNPTYIAGENMYGVISKVPSKKLFFKVNGEKFGIAYNLEQK